MFRRPFLLTLETGVKIPTGEFKNEDGLIPVGEGQWDYDIVVQAGCSFWPLPAYANVDIGYRVRTENEEILRDPGTSGSSTPRGVQPAAVRAAGAEARGTLRQGGKFLRFSQRVVDQADHLPGTVGVVPARR